MFKAEFQKNAFYVYLRGFAESRYIRTAFDTGAVYSVISVENFTERAFDRDEIIRYLDGRTKHRGFKSASGGDMNGYLVRADGISISRHHVERFYYYLEMDAGEELSLLGNDFIAKCSFSHPIDGGIVVKDCDEASYRREYDFAVGNDEIRSVIERSYF